MPFKHVTSSLLPLGFVINREASSLSSVSWYISRIFYVWLIQQRFIMMSNTQEFSPAMPIPLVFDVKKRIEMLRGYVDPANPRLLLSSHLYC